MSVRRCSVEAHPSLWVPTVSVWTCDACGQEMAVKGWPDDPPAGWYCSLADVRDARTGQYTDTDQHLHCCSFGCAEQLDGPWTRPPIGRNPVYLFLPWVTPSGESVASLQAASEWIERLRTDCFRALGISFRHASEDAVEFGGGVKSYNPEHPNKLKGHGPRCDLTNCYCADPADPDPMCACGQPGWMCRCYQNQPWDEEDETVPGDYRAPG